MTAASAGQGASHVSHPAHASPATNRAASRKAFRVACVTGTNRKTTTTTLIDAIISAAGEPSARITTLGAWVRGEPVATDATPEAFAKTVDVAAARGVK